jgi:Na+/proline symporter
MEAIIFRKWSESARKGHLESLAEFRAFGYCGTFEKPWKVHDIVLEFRLWNCILISVRIAEFQQRAVQTKGPDEFPDAAFRLFALFHLICLSAATLAWELAGTLSFKIAS